MSEIKKSNHLASLVKKFMELNDNAKSKDTYVLFVDTYLQKHLQKNVHLDT